MGKKHEVLKRILDDIRNESSSKFTAVYQPDESKTELVNYARSRAYIHLFLKGEFKLNSFEERESWITDGSCDGGIDAYYIDKVQKKIIFIQSKYRTNDDNWETKEINLSELISMHIDRVLCGEKKAEDGSPYNPEILKLINKIRQIKDISKYSYTVIILANLTKFNIKDLKRIIGEYDFEVFDTKRYWNELVFPVISGRLVKAENINFKLSFKDIDKDPGYMKYAVNTEYGKCYNYLTYVPIKEIGLLLYENKNSVLEYNPRCYLGFKNNPVNSNIKSSVVDRKTNDFSLLNNGITILSDETTVCPHKVNPQISVTNPQIINGGQTAFTLASIYKESLKTGDYSVFKNKSVLVRIVSIEGKISNESKLKLIDSLSKATNEQTPVDVSDQKSNYPIIVDLQNEILEKHGVFLRRKKGEFLEGEEKGYLNSKNVIDVVTFIRLAFSALGDPSKARRSGDKTLFGDKNLTIVLPDLKNINKYMFAFYCYRHILDNEIKCASTGDKFGTTSYGYAFRYAKYAVVCAAVKNFNEHWKIDDLNKEAKKKVAQVLKKWKDFESFATSNPNNADYFSADTDYDGYYKGKTVNADIAAYDFK